MSKSQQALRTGHVTCLGALGNSFGDLSGVGSFGGERVALSCPTKALSILRTPLGSSLLLTQSHDIPGNCKLQSIAKKRAPFLINHSNLPNKSPAPHLVPPAGRMRAPAPRAPAQLRVQAPADRQSRAALDKWLSPSVPVRRINASSHPSCK